MDDSRIGVAVETAVQIADVPRARLRRWEQADLIVPSARRTIGAHAVRIYGFDELVEMRMVRALEDRGAHIKVIQKLIRVARKWQDESGAEVHQLRWAVASDGEPLVEIDGIWLGGREPIQGVFIDVLEVEHLREEVRRRIGSRPAETLGRVEKRRGTHGSKQVFAGTRTPVSAVAPYVRRGASDAEILKAFPHLTAEDIRTARGLVSTS